MGKHSRENLVTVQYAQAGTSVSTNELGMREMQRRVYEQRNAEYMLIKAPPVEGLLAAGNTVMVRLPLGEPQRRLSVPRDALVIRADGLYVVKMNGEQRAERVAVKAGVADGDWIAVDGTVKAGDSIVVRGAESLRGNEKLDVVGVFEQDPKRLSLQAIKPDA